jgi:hypothetical protein
LAVSAVLGFAFITAVVGYQIRLVYEPATYASVNTVPSPVILDKTQTSFDTVRVLAYQQLSRSLKAY